MNKVLLILLATLTILAITEGKSCGSHHSRCNEKGRKKCTTASSSSSESRSSESSEDEDESCGKGESGNASSSSSSTSSSSSASSEENVGNDNDIKSNEKCKNLLVPTKKWKHLKRKQKCEDLD